MSIERLLKRFARDASVFGPGGLDRSVAKLERLIESGEFPSEEQTERLLRQLRGDRCFPVAIEVAGLLKDTLNPKGRIYEAQALIDSGQLDDAEEKLERLEREVEQGKIVFEAGGEREIRSEVLGLFGRLSKQRFVNAMEEGDDLEAEDALLDSVSFYQDAYPLNPSWHGANQAALSWRAEREGISLGRLPGAEEVGRQLEASLVGEGPPERLSTWDLSAFAQAKMARGDWEAGLMHYRNYIRSLEQESGRGAAFVLMGDLRQLQEIWLIDESGEGPRAEIIQLLANYILMHPDGSAQLTRKSLQSIERENPEMEEDDRELQAILDHEKTLYSHLVVKNLMKQVGSIGKVRVAEHLAEGGGGSGFLIDGPMIGLSQRGPVFVTNAHVLSEEKRYVEGTLFPGEAEIAFEDWQGESEEKVFSLDRCEWESPPQDYDVSIWRLKEFPDKIHLVSTCRPVNPFVDPDSNVNQPIGSVVPIGHPGGGSLTYTFGSNLILDHELHRDLGSPRVIHYKADTKPGSSGSPVFNRKGEVVAIHRAAARKPIPGTAKPFSGSYAANEGVGIHSVARACRRDQK